MLRGDWKHGSTQALCRSVPLNADFLQTGLTQGLAPNVEVIVIFGYLGRFDPDRLAMLVKASQPSRPPRQACPAAVRPRRSVGRSIIAIRVSHVRYEHMRANIPGVRNDEAEVKCAPEAPP